jgi:hypothetical protein
MECSLFVDVLSRTLLSLSLSLSAQITLIFGSSLTTSVPLTTYILTCRDTYMETIETFGVALKSIFSALREGMMHVSVTTVKFKVKLSLCLTTYNARRLHYLIKHRAIETY